MPPTPKNPQDKDKIPASLPGPSGFWEFIRDFEKQASIGEVGISRERSTSATAIPSQQAASAQHDATANMPANDSEIPLNMDNGESEAWKSRAGRTDRKGKGRCRDQDVPTSDPSKYGAPWDRLGVSGDHYADLGELRRLIAPHFRPRGPHEHAYASQPIPPPDPRNVPFAGAPPPPFPPPPACHGPYDPVGPFSGDEDADDSAHMHRRHSHHGRFGHMHDHRQGGGPGRVGGPHRGRGGRGGRGGFRQFRGIHPNKHPHHRAPWMTPDWLRGVVDHLEMRPWLEQQDKEETCSTQAAVNMRASATHIFVEVAVPGVPLCDLEVALDDARGTLTVSAKQQKAPTDGHVLLAEHTAGGISREIKVPYPVAADALSANLDGGVLSVVLPRADAEGR